MSLRRERYGDIAVLKLQHGKVNALDVELLERLLGQLESLRADSVSAVVLTGDGRSFCAGMDLRKILNDRPYMETLMALLTTTLLNLFLFPRPVIAAINGHAIAAGWFLTAACDYRLMARESGVVGLPERKLNLLFPAVMLELMRFTLKPEQQRQVAESAQLYTPDAALAMGMIDEIVAPEVLLSRGLEMALSLSQQNVERFSVLKRSVRRDSLDSYMQRDPNYDREVIERIAGAKTQNAIHEHLENLR